MFNRIVIKYEHGEIEYEGNFTLSQYPDSVDLDVEYNGDIYRWFDKALRDQIYLISIVAYREDDSSKGLRCRLIKGIRNTVITLV